ncbi:helix-turn-helix transcriptional regulator [Actinomyces urogenitalis]|uniref:helix-turn-helix domain-containing protein n=1 Tax=Actinomyces urogenitalis TaxID=103621 RepID=UPI00311A1A25
MNVAKSWHPVTRRRLESIGPSIRSWRRARGLSATEVADRSGISRTTLRQIETNPSGVSFGNVFAVLSVLGIDHKVAQAVDPLEDLVGRTLVLSALEKKSR